METRLDPPYSLYEVLIDFVSILLMSVGVLFLNYRPDTLGICTVRVNVLAELLLIVGIVVFLIGFSYRYFMIKKAVEG